MAIFHYGFHYGEQNEKLSVIASEVLVTCDEKRGVNGHLKTVKTITNH